jgi:hypothetical protein
VTKSTGRPLCVSLRQIEHVYKYAVATSNAGIFIGYTTIAIGDYATNIGNWIAKMDSTHILIASALAADVL